MSLRRRLAHDVKFRATLLAKAERAALRWAERGQAGRGLARLAKARALYDAARAALDTHDVVADLSPIPDRSRS